MQLRVEKADGSYEVYLHTKVLGTIAAALADGDCYQECLPEEFAEAVTTFLRRRYTNGIVTSSEIYSMIEVVLSDTGYDQAALALHEHHINRQIKRRRVEVIRCPGMPQEESDILEGDELFFEGTVQPWSKSVIVRDLERENHLAHSFSRAVGGAVEEKVLRLGIRRIRSSLVWELVLNELLMIRQAELALAEPPGGKKEQKVDGKAERISPSTEYVAVAAEA
ncbi:MAG: hypothetical protein JXD22_12180 [Sedimentisphaerales bacterium]|nr:hypothetical protein [Sedimentisphaerales bacterium]